MQRLIGEILPLWSANLPGSKIFSRQRYEEQEKNLDFTTTEEDIDADFEYNFDVIPFNYLLEELHNLLVSVCLLFLKK